MRWRRVFGFAYNGICMVGFLWLMLHAELSMYLLKMGRGQMDIILNTKKVEEVLKENGIGKEEKEKLLLAEQIKQYSVDSLGYRPTRNFTTYYDQHNMQSLWVITACRPFEFRAYHWEFPFLGMVSYKGYFTFNEAWNEYLRMKHKGYDVDISPVSAWSTLGWLPDPILSSMLRRSKGRLANLLFHELFHATYYAPGTVEVNENLADFVAHKATLLYLRSDTTELRRYLDGTFDDSLYNRFIFSGYEQLSNFYRRSESMDSLNRLKEKERLLLQIYLESEKLAFKKPGRFHYANKEIMLTRNAFFMQAKRYDGLYDSLNSVLHLKFKGDLRKMIESLK